MKLALAFVKRLVTIVLSDSQFGKVPHHDGPLGRHECPAMNAKTTKINRKIDKCFFNCDDYK